MKSILLTTTAIVAFAGAAAADGHTGVSFGGNAMLGFNDNDAFGEDGFYYDLNMNVALTAALDNGVTAAANFNIEIDDEGAQGDELTGNNDYVLASSSYVLSLTTDTAGLHFGDVAFAAETQWSGAGDMEADAFSEADGEVAIRGDVMLGGVSASVSYVVAASSGDIVADDTTDTVDQLSVGASGDLGMFSFAVAYQQEAEYAGYFANNGDFTDNEVFGVSAGTTVGGADVTVAYAQWKGVAPSTQELTSLGVQVALPVGPVTATVYYVSEDNVASDADDNYGVTVAYAEGPLAATFDYDNDQGTDKWNLDGSFDAGNGLTVLAGMQNENEGDDADYYVGGTYDLGGGAELLAVYANDEDGDQADEIGAGEYLPGTTVEVSFAF